MRELRYESVGTGKDRLSRKKPLQNHWSTVRDAQVAGQVQDNVRQVQSSCSARMGSTCLENVRQILWKILCRPLKPVQQLCNSEMHNSAYRTCRPFFEKPPDTLQALTEDFSTKTCKSVKLIAIPHSGLLVPPNSSSHKDSSSLWGSAALQLFVNLGNRIRLALRQPNAA